MLGGDPRRFDKGGDIFYEQISALHKAVRGSAPDATLYWFARMIDGGCDPLYIARRVVRMATEDIGNADPRGLELAGLGARDSLRLEAGYPLYGHEITADVSPLAAGLGWTVKLDKGSDLIGGQGRQLTGHGFMLVARRGDHKKNRDLQDRKQEIPASRRWHAWPREHALSRLS